jgi:hypothetical protein
MLVTFSKIGGHAVTKLSVNESGPFSATASARALDPSDKNI